MERFLPDSNPAMSRLGEGAGYDTADKPVLDVLLHNHGVWV